MIVGQEVEGRGIVPPGDEGERAALGDAREGEAQGVQVVAVGRPMRNLERRLAPLHLSEARVLAHAQGRRAVVVAQEAGDFAGNLRERCDLGDARLGALGFGLECRHAGAAMEGRLPRGFCIKRLTDLPMLWSEQWGAIGLQAPAQVRAELG